MAFESKEYALRNQFQTWLKLAPGQFKECGNSLGKKEGMGQESDKKLTKSSTRGAAKKKWRP